MSILISESGSEPITTAEVKTWAKVENSDEDSLISSLITSCRREIESFTKCVLRPQVWRTKYIAETIKNRFYSPRITASSVVVTVDGDTITDYLFNEVTGCLRLNYDYSNDELIVIEWTMATALSSLAPLKQALLDLITYRFYNRGLYDMPDNVKTILNMYRIFNL